MVWATMKKGKRTQKKKNIYIYGKKKMHFNGTCQLNNRVKKHAPGNQRLESFINLKNHCGSSTVDILFILNTC